MSNSCEAVFGHAKFAHPPVAILNADIAIVKIPRTLTPAAALSLLEPGMRVFVHAGPSECMTFVEALKADPERARGVEFVGVFIPGLNATDYSALAPDARIASTFVSPPFAEAFANGRLRYLPKAYSGFAGVLARMKIDLAVLRVSPPGADGRMSFGLNQDYAPIAARTARRVLAFVDRSMPHVAGEPGLAREDCDALVEIDEPLRPFPASSASGTLEKVGINAARLIRDGDTIQIGIGKVQSAVLANLFDRKRLGLHSGMIDDAIASADRQGRPRQFRQVGRPRPRRHGHGDRHAGRMGLRRAARHALSFGRLYARRRRHLRAGQFRRDQFGDRSRSARPVQRRNARRPPDQRRRRLSRFPARRGRLEGGPRHCRASRVGRRREPHRRALCPAGVATGPRNDADYIVTEYGIAALRDLDLDARAEALIMVAAPQFRSELASAWKDMRAKF
ncbi:MAG: acetyl-CoA hydrolase/transferase C-terminal domain-containing protein [Rhodoblastus sp.]